MVKMTWSMISALNWKVFSVRGSTRVWRGWLKREPSGLAAVWPNVNGGLLDPGIYTGVYFHLMDFFYRHTLRVSSRQLEQKNITYLNISKEDTNMKKR